jgi:CubicO group peptidase (beta-lactamase class C family)
MLIEEGKVGLTDPVSRFIPEFKEMKVAVEKDGEVELIAAEREVTIRDLLTHTSGLASGGLGQKKAPPELLRPGGAGATLAEGASRFAALPLDFQPGTRWRYSGRPGSTPWHGSEAPGRPSTSSCAPHLRAAGDGRHLVRRA